MMLGALLACAWAGAAPGEDGAVYQWTEAAGVVRYTRDPDRIPRSERDSVLRLEPGMPATRAPEPAEPTGTIPSMLGVAAPEAASPAAGKPSLTTTAPTPAPPSRSGAESPIGQPIPEPPASGVGPAREAPAPAPDAKPPDDEPQARVLPAAPPTARSTARSTALPAWWGAPEPYAPVASVDARAGGARSLVLADADADADTDDGDDLDARIQQLEAQIARDQHRLEDMISVDDGEHVLGLQESPELREIARRLPGLQAELAELYRERAARKGP
jgi:hypothetical protein